jgi:hypothetical protein
MSEERETWRVQVSVKDAYGTMYNFRGETVDEVADLLVTAEGDRFFSAAIATLEAAIRQAVEGALGAKSAQGSAAPAAAPAPSAAPSPAPAGGQKAVQRPDAPATEKQIGFLRKLGGTPTPGMTAGEASAAIDALLKAKRG